MGQDNRVYLFDTTLRDGQQSPGAGMSFEDNLQYAQLADALGIDVLEAGFPAASQTDFEVVQTIASLMTDIASEMIVAGLCQLREPQCIATMEALSPCLARGLARVHTYVPVDPNLMQASLGALAEDKAQIINDLARLVKLASDAGFEVEFSPEGYSRLGENFDFVTDLIRAAVANGATIINCPDTIGGASPLQGEHYFVRHMQQHADIISREFPQRDVIWSVHCHNDFGMALANSMIGVIEGPARQIEGCINGVGERAGNVALEQCMVYIKEFGAKACPTKAFYTQTQFAHLQKISDFVADKMLLRQPHVPIVGANAAKHSSGGHTNAILKHPLAYQPFDPREIGSAITFVFGPLSGSNHAKEIIEREGYRCPDEEKVAIAQAIKEQYADRRKGITDEELLQGYFYYYQPIKVEAIVVQAPGHYQLQGKFFDQPAPLLVADNEADLFEALQQQTQTFFPGLTVVDAYLAPHSGLLTEVQWQVTVKTATELHAQAKACDAQSDVALIQAYLAAVNQAYIDTHYQQGVVHG